MAIQPIQKQNLQTNTIHLAPHSEVSALEKLFYQARQESLLIENTLALSLKNLGFTPGALQLFSKRKFFTLEDLTKQTEKSLLSIKRFGPGNLQKVKDVLSQRGLSLGMTDKQREEKLRKEQEQEYRKQVEKIRNKFGEAYKKLLEKYDDYKATHTVSNEIQKIMDSANQIFIELASAEKINWKDVEQNYIKLKKVVVSIEKDLPTLSKRKSPSQRRVTNKPILEEDGDLIEGVELMNGGRHSPFGFNFDFDIEHYSFAPWPLLALPLLAGFNWQAWVTDPVVLISAAVILIVVAIVRSSKRERGGDLWFREFERGLKRNRKYVQSVIDSGKKEVKKLRKEGKQAERYLQSLIASGREKEVDDFLKVVKETTEKLSSRSFELSEEQKKQYIDYGLKLRKEREEKDELWQKKLDKFMKKELEENGLEIKDGKIIRKENPDKIHGLALPLLLFMPVVLAPTVGWGVLLSPTSMVVSIQVVTTLFLGTFLATYTFNRQQKEKEHQEWLIWEAVLRRKPQIKAIPQQQPFISQESQLAEMAL